MREREELRQAVARSIAAGALLLSALLVLASARHRLPLNATETVGVLAGGWTVWLTAARSLWTWPAGILGSLVFAGVFGRSALYGAMGMQVLYASLALVGWYWWRFGGSRQEPLKVAAAPVPILLILTASVGALTPALTFSLRYAHDAAPTLDALATALSLAAQFLVMRKWIENWYFWIAADVVYVVLNLSHGLPLFGLLYVTHLGVCGYGLWQWRREFTLRPV